jgi:DNA adenine methylase
MERHTVSGGRMSTLAPTRPLLRYHGGKWRLAPWILDFFPKHQCYVEPYGGGASLLLQKERSYAEVYNDLDAEVANLFKVARERHEELVWAIGLTPYSREEFKLSLKPVADELEQARRTLVRSHMGFGSGAASGERTGFRGSAVRSYTTPADDWAQFPDALRRVIERLQGIYIENRHALQVMHQHDAATTLHYVDPPYPLSTRKLVGRSQVYRHEMTDNEHRELATTLHSLKGYVVISGYACELYFKELYADWHCAQRAAMADGAKQRIEYLWINPACAQALASQNAQLPLL